MDNPSSQLDHSVLVNSGSSFSDLPENFFRGHVFEERFKTSIATKQFVYEKILDLFYVKNSPLGHLFKSCGLTSMLFPPTKAYPRLVQQFYTNLECHNDCYTSFVKGKSLFFTVVDFGSILNIPSDGPCPFTLKGAANTPFPPLEQLHIVMNKFNLTTLCTPKTVDVCPTACVIHKLVRYNLFPRLGGGSDFTYQDLVVVAMILKGVSFNYSLMMLSHMLSCIRQSKKCLPYGCFLTKIFQHFNIYLDDEIIVSTNEFVDAANLKQSHLSLVNGVFVRAIPDPVPISPTTPSSSSTLPNQSDSSPEIINMLTTILQNQETMQVDIIEIKHRLNALEKGKLPMRKNDLQQCITRMEDEFIDLQAGFELHTAAMVESLQRKINRNSCQLSQELKFVSSQLGEFADFVAVRFNDVGQRLHFQTMYSTIPEWPRCNWMAEYVGDFLDLPLPNSTFIPRPPRFADTLSLEERLHRILHRPYFTTRPPVFVNIEDID